ncbi:MAG: GGDEF domain-containing protein [Solirubrobacteraceae bacterium]
MSLAPFAAVALAAWLAVGIGASPSGRAYAASVAALAITAVLARLQLRARWHPGVGQVPASLTFLLAVALLRQSAGGIRAGVVMLSMIPVFYTALSSTDRRHLHSVLAGLLAFYVLPIILVGPPPYPNSEWRAALVSVAVAAIVGLATQRLVASVRFQATEAERRERMLDQVGRLVRTLFESADPRTDLCQGPLAISEAACAVLLEPGDGGALVATAAAGFEAAPISLAPGCRHPAHEVFRSGRPRLLTSRLAELPGPALWALDEPPGTVLFQPLLKGGDPWGVLVVAWRPGLVVAGARATVVALLAHEAAAAIARADQINLLSGMVQTDPLTGLPNRRAWDERLARAVAEGQRFAVAILDLDHFKLFNDTHGHPAGDQLLRDTAAAWREQLRCGDLLARLGGEEFGLLLFDCDLDAANEVTERLRRLVTSDQTCSVGLALRQAEEAVDVALARADRALYEAKASGRDRACVGA